MKGINQIIPLAQGTMTGLAIKYVMNAAFTAEEGDRPKVTQFYTSKLNPFQSKGSNICWFQLLKHEDFQRFFCLFLNKMKSIWVLDGRSRC